MVWPSFCYAALLQTQKKLVSAFPGGGFPALLAHADWLRKGLDPGAFKISTAHTTPHTNFHSSPPTSLFPSLHDGNAPAVGELDRAVQRVSNLAGVFADGLAYQRANQLLVLLIRRVKLLPIQYNLRMVLPASERTSFFGAYLRISEPRVRGMAAESARELTNSVREPRVRGMVAELSLSLSPGDERAKSTVHATWLCAHKKVHNSTKTWNRKRRRMHVSYEEEDTCVI
jgi:hypothetical protein